MKEIVPSNFRAYFLGTIPHVHNYEDIRKMYLLHDIFYKISVGDIFSYNFLYTVYNIFNKKWAT